MYVAFLRGINVGGKNKLPMKDLVEMFVTAGAEDVRSYIQSGNVIFRASPGIAARLSGQIATQIATSFGYRTPVILRTAEQLRGVISDNPFLKAGAAEETLHVMFLADLPSPTSVENLDPDRSPPDSVRRAWQRGLSAASEWRRKHQTHQQLLRLEARHDEHRQELANGDQAPGTDGRLSWCRTMT